MRFWKKKKEDWLKNEILSIMEEVTEKMKPVIEEMVIEEMRKDDFVRGYEFGLGLLKDTLILRLDTLNKEWPDIFYKGVIDQLTVTIKKIEENLKKVDLKKELTWSDKGEKNE